MRGGGCKPVKLGEVLLTRQNQFCCRQSIRQATRFIGHTRRINANERRTQHNGDPDSGHIKRWQGQGLARHPGQRIVKNRQEASESHDEPAQQQGRRRRQRHRRDHNRGQEEHGEGVLQPAGQIEQARELQNVIAEQEKGEPIPEPIACRKPEAEPDIKPSGGRNRDKTKT